MPVDRGTVNITISVEAELLERAREVARTQGTSLQELIRAYLLSLGSDRAPKARAERLIQLMNQHGGHSGGARFRRLDAYEDQSE